MRRLPMFPLGSPLVPNAGVPLHVFEERYRALLRDLTAGDGEFGVVLIERGSEVGGGDTRATVGTLARIADAAELSDGRWVLIAVGVARLRVAEWLPDDPYPLALVEVLDDPSPSAGEEVRHDLEARVRRIAGLLAELGDPAPPITVELADDPGAAAWQAAAVTPLAAVDVQRLLETDDPDRRLEDLRSLLGDLEDLLRLRIGG